MSVQTDTHHYFWRGPFSNWHRKHKLIIDPIMDDQMFATSEAAFMMYKAIFFNDHRVADLIAKENDPAKVKAYGREIKGYDDKLWACMRVGYMQYVCYLKFSQNEELKAELLSTGSRVLVEASPLDAMWGVKLAEEDPLILDVANWKGLNLLGQALMTVREMVR